MADNEQQKAKLQILLELIPKTERKAFAPLLEDVFSLTNNIANKSQEEFDKNLVEISKKFKSLVRSLNVFAESEKIEGPFGKDFLNSIKGAGNAKEIAKALAEQFKLVNLELGKLKGGAGTETINAFGFAVKNAKADVSDLIKEVRILQKENLKIKPPPVEKPPKPEKPVRATADERRQASQQVKDSHLEDVAAEQADKVAKLFQELLKNAAKKAGPIGALIADDVANEFYKEAEKRFNPQALEKDIAPFLKQAALSGKQLKKILGESEVGVLRDLQDRVATQLKATPLNDSGSGVQRELLKGIVKELEKEIVLREKDVDIAKKEGKEQAFQYENEKKLAELEDKRLKNKIKRQEENRKEKAEQQGFTDSNTNLAAGAEVEKTKASVEKAFEGLVLSSQEAGQQIGEDLLAAISEAIDVNKDKSFVTLEKEFKELTRFKSVFEKQRLQIIDESQLGQLKQTLKLVEAIGTRLDPSKDVKEVAVLKEVATQLNRQIILREDIFKEAKKTAEQDIKASKLPLGSIAQLKEQVKSFKIDLELEVSPEGRKNLEETIKKAEAELGELQGKAKEIGKDLTEDSLKAIRVEENRIAAAVKVLPVLEQKKAKLKEENVLLRAIFDTTVKLNNQAPELVPPGTSEKLAEVGRQLNINEASLETIDGQIQDINKNIVEATEEFGGLSQEVLDIVGTTEEFSAAIEASIKDTKELIKTTTDPKVRQEAEGRLAALKKIETSLNSQETLSRKIANVQKELAQARNLRGSLDVNSKEYAEASNKVLELEQNLRKLRKGISESSSTLADFAQGARVILGDRLAGLLGQTQARLEVILGKSVTQLKGTREELTRLGGAFTSVLVGGGIGLVFGEAIKNISELRSQIKELVADSIKYAKEQSRLINLTGLQRDKAAGLSLAFKSVGASFNDIQDASAQILQKLNEAQTAGSVAGQSFKTFGIDVKKTELNINSLLDSLAKGFNALPPGLTRTAELGRIAGEEGSRQLAAILPQLQLFNKIAKESGLILDKNVAKSLKEAGLQQDELNARIEAFKVLLGSEAVPIIAELNAGLIDLIKETKKYIEEIKNSGNLQDYVNGFKSLTKIAVFFTNVTVKLTSTLIEFTGFITSSVSSLFDLSDAAFLAANNLEKADKNLRKLRSSAQTVNDTFKLAIGEEIAKARTEIDTIEDSVNKAGFAFERTRNKLAGFAGETQRIGENTQIALAEIETRGLQLEQNIKKKRTEGRIDEAQEIRELADFRVEQAERVGIEIKEKLRKTLELEKQGHESIKDLDGKLALSQEALNDKRVRLQELLGAAEKKVTDARIEAFRKSSKGDVELLEQAKKRLEFQEKTGLDVKGAKATVDALQAAFNEKFETFLKEAGVSLGEVAKASVSEIVKGIEETGKAADQIRTLNENKETIFTDVIRKNSLTRRGIVQEDAKQEVLIEVAKQQRLLDLRQAELLDLKKQSEKRLTEFEEVINKTNDGVNRFFGNITDGSGVAAGKIRDVLGFFTQGFDVSKIQGDIDKLFQSIQAGGQAVAKNKLGQIISIEDIKPQVDKAKITLTQFNAFILTLRERKLQEEIEFNDKEIALQKDNIDELKKLKLKGLQLDFQLQDLRFQKEQAGVANFKAVEDRKLEILKKSNLQQEIFSDQRIKLESRVLALQIERVRKAGGGELDVLQKLKGGYLTLLNLQLAINKAKLAELEASNFKVEDQTREETAVIDGKLLSTGKQITEQVRVQKEDTKEISDLKIGIKDTEIKIGDILDRISGKISQEEYLARQNFNVQSETEKVLENQNKALEKQNDLLEEGGKKGKKRKPAFQVVPVNDSGPDRDIHPEKELNPEAPNVASVVGDSFAGEQVKLEFDTPENVAKGKAFVQDLFHDATAVENFFGAQGAEFAKVIRETAEKISASITEAENKAAQLAADEAYAIQLEKAKEFQANLSKTVEQFAKDRDTIEKKHQEDQQDIISSRLDLIADVNSKRVDIESKATKAIDDLEIGLAKRRKERLEKDIADRVEAQFQLSRQLATLDLDDKDKALSREEDFITEKSDLLEQIKELEKTAAEGQPEPDRKKAQEDLVKLKDTLAKLEAAETRRKEREAKKRAAIAEAEAEAEEIAKTDPDRARSVLSARKKAIDAEFDLEEKFQEDLVVLTKRGDTAAIAALTALNAQRKAIIAQRTTDELNQIAHEAELKKAARAKELQDEKDEAEARRKEIAAERQQELSDLDNFFIEKFSDITDALQKEKAAYKEQIAEIKDSVIEALKEMGINVEDFGGLLDEVLDALDKKGSTIKETIVAISEALKEIFKTGGAGSQAAADATGGGTGTTTGAGGATGGGATGGGGGPFGSGGGGAATGGAGSGFGGAGAGGATGGLGGGPVGGSQPSGGGTPASGSGGGSPTKGDSKADKQSRAKAALIQAFINGRKSGSASELIGRLNNAGSKLVSAGDLTSSQKFFLVRRGLQSATEGEFGRSLSAVLEGGKDPSGKFRFSLEQARGRIRYLYSQYKKKLIPIEGVYAGIQELEATQSIDSQTGNGLSQLIGKIKEGDLSDGLGQIDDFFKTAKAGEVKEGQGGGKDTDFDNGEDTTGGAATNGGGSAVGGGGGGGGSSGSKTPKTTPGADIGVKGGKGGNVIDPGTIGKDTKLGGAAGKIKTKDGSKGPKGDIKPTLPPRKTKKNQLQEFFFQKLSGKPLEDLPSLLNQFLLLRNPEFQAAYPGFEDEVVQLGDIQAVVVDYIDQLVKLEYISADKAPAILDYFKLTGKGGGSGTGLVDVFRTELSGYIAPDIKINTSGPGGSTGGGTRKDTGSPTGASASPSGGSSLSSSGGNNQNRVSPNSTASTVASLGVGAVSSKGVDESSTSFQSVAGTGAGGNSPSQAQSYTITIPVTVEADTIVAVDKRSADAFEDRIIKKVSEATKAEFSRFLGARAIKG